MLTKIKNWFHKKELSVVPKEQQPDKPIAEQSCYFMLQNGGKTTSYICPNFPFKIEYDNKDITLTLHFSFPKVDVAEGQPSLILVDYTNDPTPPYAGCVCSLGYYVLRVSFNNSEITQEPTKWVCKGKLSDFSIYINRPQRVPYEEVSPVPADLNMFKENTKYTKSYIFQQSNWEPVQIITLLDNGEKFGVVQEILDLRSFYSGQVLVFNRLFDTKQEAINLYNDGVKTFTKQLKEEFRPCIYI